MPITTVGVGAAVTPTVVKTYISHYIDRKPRHEKPTAHISYDEGLHLIRSFLDYASHHTVEDLQAFTAQWVPSPSWVRTENLNIPAQYTTKAADTIIAQLGPDGVQQVGGQKWWQWRPKDHELKAEWIEMRSHYNEQKKKGGRSRRIMLYVHGGAYFFGSVDEHRYQMQRHARKLKARVFAPRYRLAPQFPFPCGLQDCLAAYLYLLSVHDPSEIILAGDSAGGGMVVSILCMLRDRGMPLPAGAILISPWVDLTHSFPSLGGTSDFDYIPAHGFMQKPSQSWPPPTDEEMSIIQDAARGNGRTQSSIVRGSALPSSEQKKPNRAESQTDQPEKAFPDLEPPASNGGELKVGSQLHLSITLEGKSITLKEQIQMYTTNQLLTHPLVSPVLQPSLGGLPPLLILTGGGEVLRDEQIYLAHKAANPSKYPLSPAYQSRYDPDGTLSTKYKPTPVQLQVWEDLCHVAPTLSFTRPAKYMYRSIAQFGAWALARAQRRAIEIVDDDNISIISARTDTDSDENQSSTDDLAKHKIDLHTTTGSVGVAGDAIPPFVNNMIRQRIDRSGRIYRLAEASELPALQLHPDEVGVVKPGPVQKWLQAKSRWDNKYSSARHKVQKERIKALASGHLKSFAANERPPPSALAGRRTDKDLVMRKQRKSYGLAMWSGWGSKHDEATLKREQEAEEMESAEASATVEERPTAAPVANSDGQIEITPASETPTPSTSRQQSKSRSRNRSTSTKRKTANDLKSQAGRRRTISVTDAGQTEAMDTPPPPLPTLAPTEPDQEQPDVESETPSTSKPPPIITTDVSAESSRDSSDTALLSAGFIPKFKTASHLRDDSGGTQPASEVASIMTGRSGVVADDASTRAVFSVPGVIDPRAGLSTDSASVTRPGSPLANETRSILSDLDSAMPDEAGENPLPVLGSWAERAGNDSPRSQRSLERLLSHQQDEGMAQLQPLRSPSSIAVVRMEGVVGIVDDDPKEQDQPAQPSTASTDAEPVERNSVADNEEDVETPRADQSVTQNPMAVDSLTTADRPQLYDRSNTEFQTATEKL